MFVVKITDAGAGVGGGVRVGCGSDGNVMTLHGTIQCGSHAGFRGCTAGNAGVLFGVHTGFRKRGGKGVVCFVKRKKWGMPEQFDRIRVGNAVKQTAFRKRSGMFKETAVCVIDINSLPEFRFMIKGKVVDEVNAANRKVERCMTDPLCDGFGLFRKEAYFQTKPASNLPKSHP